jgi:hypothetical protein
MFYMSNFLGTPLQRNVDLVLIVKRPRATALNDDSACFTCVLDQADTTQYSTTKSNYEDSETEIPADRYVINVDHEAHEQLPGHLVTPEGAESSGVRARY